MKPMEQIIVVKSKQKFEIGDYIISWRFDKISLGTVYQVIKPILRKDKVKG